MSKVVPESDVLDALSGGPVKMNDLEKVPPLRVEDRRGIAVTVDRLLREEKIRTVGCTPSHEHSWMCVVEVAR